MRVSRPYDMTKFRKEQNKRLNIRDGFYDPLTWIDTGNFALNKMMSGDFNSGVPIGSVSTFAGESGSGKSLIVSGNIIRNALADGISVVLLDTENAVKKKWAEALGVQTDHPNLLRWPKSTINQVARTIADFTDEYRDEHHATPREEQPPVLFVIDSLGNLDTETSLEQFKSGDLRGDKGIFAKQLKAMLKSTMGMFEGYQIGMACTNHTYKSQDMYSPGDVIGGGSGPIFLSDIVMVLNKFALKEDDDGNKTKSVQGIRAKGKCVKSRYAKPFEEVEVHIPYDRGMDPYSGLFDMFVRKVLVKDGTRYVYTSRENGKEHKLFRKHMDGEFFDMLMREYDDTMEPVGVNEVPEVEDVE
jgi:RecA/RadA recombinase